MKMGRSGFTLVELLVVIASLAVLPAASLQAAPRLLDSFFPFGGGLSASPPPFTLIFSEPMDSASIVLPDAAPPGVDPPPAPNPNASFSLSVLDSQYRWAPYVPWGAMSVSTREGGRIVQITPRYFRPISDDTEGGGGYRMTLRAGGFRSVAGETLGNDVQIFYYTCERCTPHPTPWPVFTFPTAHEPITDPNQPLSLDFDPGAIGTGVDPAYFAAELRLGPDSPAIGPLSFRFEDPTGRRAMPVISENYRRVIVDHPPLQPSTRPWVLRVFRTQINPQYGEAAVDLPFTFGPALAGDVDGDGTVSVRDAVTALQAAVGIIPLAVAPASAADVSPRFGAGSRSIGDGAVTVADVTRILRRAAGLIPDAIWP